MKEKIFENIRDEKLRIFWSGNEYYSADILTNEDRGKLKQIHCKRYFVENIQSKDMSLIVDDFLTDIGNIIFNDYLKNIYQIYIEHSAKAISRVRSYKGFLPQKGNDINTFIEIEVPIENKTIFGGIINLSEKNYKDNIELIWDRNTSFIICSKNEYFSKDFIISVISNYRNKETITYINYLKLIIDFCLAGDKIYKVGGSVSDQSLTVDCFFMSS